MKNSLITVAVLGFLLGTAYAVYAYMAAPTIAINEPKEPPLCLVERVIVDENGYGVFSDNGSPKSYVLITSTGVEVHEEALSNRSNCIE